MIRATENQFSGWLHRIEIDRVGESFDFLIFQYKSESIRYVPGFRRIAKYFGYISWMTYHAINNIRCILNTCNVHIVVYKNFN